MLKFYRLFGQKLLVHLALLRYRHGFSLAESDYEAARWLRGHQTDDEQLNIAVNYASEDLGQDKDLIRNNNELVVSDDFVHENDNLPLLDYFIKTLTKQLNKDNNREEDEPNEGNLVDTIVEVLRLTYSVNRISGRMIQQLKQAILLPDELTKFKQELRKNELFCAGCGKQFVRAELTILSTNEGNGGPIIYCTACMMPDRMSCQAGKHTVGIPKSLNKVLLKHRESCDDCRANPPEVLDTIEAAVVDEASDINRLMDTPVRWGTIPSGELANTGTGIQYFSWNDSNGPSQPLAVYTGTEPVLGRAVDIDRATNPEWQSAQQLATLLTPPTTGESGPTISWQQARQLFGIRGER